MTSRAPGGWSPYGGPVPDEPPPARPPESKRPPYVLATLVILEFFVIVGLVGWLYWKYHHDKNQPAGPAPAASVKSLSHQAVESYIDDHFNLAGVTCNEGANFPMTSNGATFECAGRADQKFVVTVTNKATGDYTVRNLTPVHVSKHPKPQSTKKNHKKNK